MLDIITSIQQRCLQTLDMLFEWNRGRHPRLALEAMCMGKEAKKNQEIWLDGIKEDMESLSMMT